MLRKLTVGVWMLLSLLVANSLLERGSRSLRAQGPVTTTGAPNPKTSNGAPTGGCGPQDTDVDTTTGNFYTCTSGAWQLVSGGGGTPGGLAGQVQIQSSGSTFAGASPIYASQKAGSPDIGAQVNAAITALGSNNGWVTADFFGGTISTTITIPPGVRVWFYPGTFVCNVSPCAIDRGGARLTGSGGSSALGSFATVFQPATGVDGDVIEGIDTSCCWHNGIIEDLIVNGNKANVGFTISSISRTTNVVTVTTSATCNFVAGSGVNHNVAVISGVTDTSFNGSFPVASGCGGGTTFTYNQTGANASSSGGKASGTVGIHTFAMGEAGAVRQSIVTNSPGVGVLHEGSTAGTSITEGIGVFNALGCGFYFMNVSSRGIMHAIGGDTNPQLLCVRPASGGGGYFLTVNGMKVEGGGAGVNEPAVLLDGSDGNMTNPSVFLFTNVIAGQGSGNTNFIKCMDVTGSSACDPDVIVLGSTVAGYTNMFNDTVDSDVRTLASSNPSAFFHSSTANQFTTSGISLYRSNKPLSNGLNSNICLGPGGVMSPSSWNITGPTAAFSIGGLTCQSGGGDGRIFTLYNGTTQPMTIVNEDASSTAANRIKTGTGGNILILNQFGAAIFQYSTADSRWILLGTTPGADAHAGTPSCAFTTGGGASPSCTLLTGATDSSGTMVATTGTGSPGSSGTITLTFSAPFGVNTPACIWDASDTGAGQWSARVNFLDTTASTASDKQTWDNNGTVLSASTAYRVNYRCYAK